MKIIFSMLFSLLVFLPAHSMEEKSVSGEKLILIVEPSDNIRETIPTIIKKKMKEHLAAEFGNVASLDTYFDLVCSTSQEARNQFPSSALYIVTLGAGEAPINYNDFGRITESPSVKYHAEMTKLVAEMEKELLPFTHKRIQVILDSSTLASNNQEAFRQAALSVDNPSNPKPEARIFTEIVKKLIEHKKKSAK